MVSTDHGRRRRVAAMASGALLVAALGAASAAPASAQDGVQTSGWEELGDVTLRVAGENASAGTLQTLAGMFTEQYPNVTFEFDFKAFDPYMDTLFNVADLPDAPDIFFGNQGYTFDGSLVGAGLIISLEPYYEAYGWGDWYGEGAMSQFRFTEDGSTFGEGPRWGISESAEVVGIFYNAAKLAELGIEPPTTYAELASALETAAAAGELPIKLGNLEGWPATHVAGVVQGAYWPAAEIRDWVFGVEGADYTAPENVQAFADLKTWVDNGWIDSDANGLAYDQAWQQFAEGDGVFLPAGNWLAADLLERMGDDVGFIAPPPGESGKVVAVSALSLPFHISSKSEHPDLAAAFIDFVMNPDKGQVYYDAGRVPAAAGAVGESTDPLVQDVGAAWERLAADDGQLFFQDWATDTMFDTLTSRLQELIGDRISPEDFVAAVQEDWAAFHSDS